MGHHKSKKKKKKTDAPAERNRIKPGIIKKYLPYAVGFAVFGVFFYLLFGPKISVSHKKNKLKELNVILITLDTLRMDFVGAYGKGMAETPNMDGVAREGVLFETCIAQTPLTLPSHTTILSGTYPLYHQVRDNGGFLVPESLELISETLKKKGFLTSAFIAAYVLHSKWGINQGFDTYSDEFDLTKYERFSLGDVQKRAEEILPIAKKWLKAHKNDKFFTWIHLYDPHTPYDPPSPFKERFAKRPYRGEVEYMDDQLGLFFRFLNEEGLYDKSLIILVGDHGEALGQHDERTHGFFIYEPTVRVPLIIRAPFRFPVKKIPNMVELVDLAPTILEALGVSSPPSYQGQSLLGLMFGENLTRRDVAYTESYFPRMHFGWSELKALYYDNQWKYILSPKDELYDLSADFDEKENLSLKKSYQARRAKERIERFIRENSRDARTPGDAKNLDKEDMQRLAALGYLTTVVDTTGKTDLPDPKGKVHVFNKLTKSKEYMAREEYDEAIETLKKILKTDPGIVDAVLQLGNAYSRKRMYEEALKYYYEVLNQKPDYNAAMVNIISSLRLLGRYDKGIEEGKRFLKTFPTDHTILNELAELYLFKKEVDKALEVLTTSLKVEKVNPKAFLQMGVIYIIKEDFQEAGNFLEKALKINPNLYKLHFHLAQVEEARGNIEKAMEHYKKELELYPRDFKSAYNLAEALRNRGQYEEAVKYYKQSIDGNPHFNIPYFMVARYYMDRGENIDEALELCEKGLEIEPPNKYTVFGYFILSDIYSRKGDKASSNSYYLKGEALKNKLMNENRWE